VGRSKDVGNSVRFAARSIVIWALIYAVSSCGFIESEHTLYDGRIRDFYYNNEPCGKIQLRKDGGIVISDCDSLADLIGPAIQ
jgi:hypothetical protein